MNTYGDGNTYRDEISKDSDVKTYSYSDAQLPSSQIQFYKPDGVEVMRISKEGITVHPDLTVDEVAQAVINALEVHIKKMVNREWVGLTDEERGACINTNMGTGLWAMAKDVEAKLKEKNGIKE
jgi:hypothetical protein